MHTHDRPRRPGQKQRNAQPFLTGALVCTLLFLLYAIASQLPGPALFQAPGNATPVGWQTFVNQVKAGNVRAVLMRGNAMTADLAHSLQGPPCQLPPTLSALSASALSASAPGDDTCLISLSAPPQSTGQLLSLFLQHAVVVDASPPPPAFSTGLQLFCQLALLMILLILISGFLRRNRSPSLTPRSPEQLSAWLKSRTRTAPPSDRAHTSSPARTPVRSSTSSSPPTTFADVAGIDEVRAELAEVVLFLRRPERFQRLGAHIPRGILLAGPPGTGKTLLARAVAGEAGVPFLHMSASEFVEVFVGVGASRVRDLFCQARACAPCVVFLDEIDAVGRKRTLRPLDTGERDQTLNQLLTELDGFQSRGTVVLLAATNRADMLDPALLRPGRFDRQITVLPPDVRGREAILRIHTRSTPLDDSVRLDHLARLSAGMNGADLANLVNEAALCAARADLSALTPECFAQALTRIQLGALRSLVIDERERRIVAVHECGHALVASSLPEADRVDFLTILAHGRHAGATRFAIEERSHLNRAQLMARIAVGLGGRVAVEMVCGLDEVTTRAEKDLQEASALARRMVTRWGMGKELDVVCAAGGASASPLIGQVPGPPSYGHPGTGSRSMEAVIDREVQRILRDGRQTAHRILSAHRAQLLLLATILMEQEQLDREQFETLLARSTSATSAQCQRPLPR